ncbi:MAG: hypothetical protein RLZZ58_698 [Pseudomonadota bacterium]
MTLPLALLLMLMPAPAPLMPVPPPDSSTPAPDPYFTIAFDPAADAMGEVDLRLARAKLSGKRVLLVMGYNGCHDSGWFANLMEKPRFQSLLFNNFELAYIDVGMPQRGKGRNLDIARRFGLKKLKGTPTIAVLDANGRLLNKKQAPTWRNVASWTEDATYAGLSAYALPRAAH